MARKLAAMDLRPTAWRRWTRLRLSTELIAMDANNADGHALMGNIHATWRRFDQAIVSGERSVGLAPNVAINHGVLAPSLYCTGRFQECLMRIRRAIRLSPYFPDWFLLPLGEGCRGASSTERRFRAGKIHRGPDQGWAAGIA